MILAIAVAVGEAVGIVYLLLLVWRLAKEVARSDQWSEEARKLLLEGIERDRENQILLAEAAVHCQRANEMLLQSGAEPTAADTESYYDFWIDALKHSN